MATGSKGATRLNFLDDRSSLVSQSCSYTKTRESPIEPAKRMAVTEDGRSKEENGKGHCEANTYDERG